MVDLQEVFRESLNEWLDNLPKYKDQPPILLSSGQKIPREQLAHAEMLILHYHQALMKELAKEDTRC